MPNGPQYFAIFHMTSGARHKAPFTVGDDLKGAPVSEIVEAIKNTLAAPLSTPGSLITLDNFVFVAEQVSAIEIVEG